jgi:immune inhibitor A
MKRRLFTSIAAFFLIFICTDSFAVPAKKGTFHVRQSDGTVLTLERFGDEFFHYTRTSDGFTVVQDHGGNYCFAKLSSDGVAVSTGIPVRPLVQLSAAERGTANGSMDLVPYKRSKISFYPVVAGRLSASSPFKAAFASSTLPDVNQFGGWGGEKKGDFRSLVILVNFKDEKFSVENPLNSFKRMLNESGYSDNGGTGSANDYFRSCSNGKFNPIFDVVGPYTVSQPMAYYGGNDSDGSDKNPAVMVLEACQLADADVDFSQYSENGTIRNIFIYYAGHNEAEGGPDDAIWPHQWNMFPGYNIPSNSNLYFDGALLDGYACSSEFRGASGNMMCGIGTLAHEFGHVIKLPDLYDTDYDANGVGTGMDYASVMDSGCYLNNGCTPPSYGMFERWMLGWAKPTLVKERGRYVLEPVYDDKGFMLQTENEGEYFLMDNRSANVDNQWDTYLLGKAGSGSKGGGMLLYHIDESSAYESYWASNKVNAHGSHSCASLLKASENNRSTWFFPGTLSITKVMNSTRPSLVSWGKKDSPLFIIDISVDGNNVVFFAADSSDFVKVLKFSVDSIVIPLNKATVIEYKQYPETALLTSLTWKSSDQSVAKVSDGIVTGVNDGTCLITATNSSNSNVSSAVKVVVLPAISDMKVNMGQYDGTVSWTSDVEYDKWKVACVNEESQVVVDSRMISGTEHSANFQGMTPGINYTFLVSGMLDGTSVTRDYKVSGTAKYAQQGAKPTLGGIPSTCSQSESVVLRLQNIPYSIKSVSWLVDGVTSKDTSIKLSKGVHVITAVITDSNAVKEYLVKYITVTE